MFYNHTHNQFAADILNNDLKYSVINQTLNTTIEKLLDVGTKL